MTDLEQLCEEALYEEIRKMEDGKSIVRDIPTGKLFYKKSLEIYNLQVFKYLKEHKSRYVPGVQAFWQDGDKLVVIEEFVQGQTLEEMIMADIRDSGQPESNAIKAPAAGHAANPAANALTAGQAAISTGKTFADKVFDVADKAHSVADEAPDLDQTALTFRDRIDILSQICDGLTFLHSANPPIIHRDIKASNIMVTDDRIVKIIDYDAAKIYVTGQKKDTVMIGTQGLAAPEQYGFAQSDVRTDLYALGKLVARMLPGNPDAQRISAKATEMDPNKRYTSAAQMKAQILRIREHITTLDDRLEKIPGYDAMNPSHRLRARLAIAAGCLAVCFLTVLLGWRLFVYPVQAENRLQGDLLSISQMTNEDDQFTQAVTDLIANNDYRRMSAGQKKMFRDGMEDIMERCYQYFGSLQAEEFRDALTEAYGEAETWEAVMQYAKAAYQIERSSPKTAIATLYSLREAGAPDAQEHWEAGLAKILEKARDQQSKYNETKDDNNLRMSLKTYLIAAPYDEAAAQEARDFYNACLAEARQVRENGNYSRADILFMALKDVVYADDEKNKRTAASSAGKTGSEDKASAEAVEKQADDSADTQGAENSAGATGSEDQASAGAGEQQADASTEGTGTQDTAQSDTSADAQTPSAAALLGALSEEEFDAEINETDYLKAGAEFDKKNYTIAANDYKNLGDYKDSQERYRESIYQHGLWYRDREKYSSAIGRLKEIPGYKDADTVLADCKYHLCQESVDAPTAEVYEYMEELAEAGYPGAEELRDEMYEWRVEITSAMAYSLGSMQAASIYAALSGGPPDGAVVITFTIYDPTFGETKSWSDGKSYHSGETASVQFSEEESSYSLFDLTYKVTVYAKGDGIDGVLGTWEGYFDEEYRSNT